MPPDLFFLILDVGHGRMEGGGNAAHERHHQARILDGFGERVGGARRAARATFSRRLSDEADRYSESSSKTIRQLLKSMQYDTGPIVVPRWRPETGSRTGATVEELIGLGQTDISAASRSARRDRRRYPEHADSSCRCVPWSTASTIDQYMATLKTLYAYITDPKKRDVASSSMTRRRRWRLLTDALDGAA